MRDLVEDVEQAVALERLVGGGKHQDDYADGYQREVPWFDRALGGSAADATRRVACPLLVLWGAAGSIGGWYDPVALWTEHVAGPVTGRPVEAGHFLAEEQPVLVADLLGAFFSAPGSAPARAAEHTAPPGQIAYKVMAADELDAWRQDGVFAGSAADRADGFIHLSTALQLASTVDRHFAGGSGLVVVAIDLSLLGDAVRWEPARDGALFPHVYGTLSRASVLAAGPLARTPDGAVRLPVARLH